MYAAGVDIGKPGGYALSKASRVVACSGMVQLPGALMNAVCSAVDGTLKHLLAHGTTQGSPVPTFTMDQLHELVGFPEVWAFEKRWAK
jgi:hypothetical protein